MDMWRSAQLGEYDMVRVELERMLKDRIHSLKRFDKIKVPTYMLPANVREAQETLAALKDEQEGSEDIDKENATGFLNTDIPLVLKKRLVREIVDSKSQHGAVAMVSAAANGYTKIVDFLLKRGGDVNVANSMGYTPLHWAVQHGHTEIVKMLLAHGADPHLLNKFGFSSSDYASTDEMREHLKATVEHVTKELNVTAVSTMK